MFCFIYYNFSWFQRFIGSSYLFLIIFLFVDSVHTANKIAASIEGSVAISMVCGSSYSSLLPCILTWFHMGRGKATPQIIEKRGRIIYTPTTYHQYLGMKTCSILFATHGLPPLLLHGSTFPHNTIFYSVWA